MLVWPTTAPLRDKAATSGVRGAHPQRETVDLGRSFGQLCGSSRFQPGFDQEGSLDPAENLSKQLAGDGDLGHLESDVPSMPYDLRPDSVRLEDVGRADHRGAILCQQPCRQRPVTPVMLK